MAICNIFKQLTKETGTFLTFSQYAEDVTKQHSVSNYRVVPSKFYACNIDYANFDNKTLPILFQNKFENACAYLKNTYPDWNPTTSKTLFWNAIRDLIIGNEVKNGKGDLTGKYSSSIVYVGDINIQSYSNKDNIGYNEIYCYIPNSGKKCKVEFEKTENSNYVSYNDEYICGYSENDETISGVMGLKVRECSQVDKIYDSVIYYTDDLFLMSDIKETNDDLFSFNTIIVTYNIDSDGEELYDIPLGIYFTGTTIDGGGMTNSVTKFVSNNDIYGAGTSYGLRICSRFTIAPNSTSIKSEVDFLKGDDAEYAAFSQAMSQMAESQIKMDEVIEKINDYNVGMKNHIMSLTSSNINVPYILEVNGKPYWFINGKNTGYEVSLVHGEDGKDGYTPEIGENGNWFINGIDTGKNSKGEVGPQGVQGLTIKGEIEPSSLVLQSIFPINSKINDAYIISRDAKPSEEGRLPENPRGAKKGDLYVCTKESELIGDGELTYISPPEFTCVYNITGPQGEQGVQGPQGENGKDGKDGNVLIVLTNSQIEDFANHLSQYPDLFVITPSELCNFLMSFIDGTTGLDEQTLNELNSMMKYFISTNIKGSFIIKTVLFAIDDSFILNSYTNLQGEKGNQGPKGEQGIQGPQGERGSILILDNSLTSTVLEDVSQTTSIVEALNFRPGDYTISYDTNTIYMLNNSGDAFTKHNCLTPTQALIDEVTKKVTENLLMNWVDVYE